MATKKTVEAEVLDHDAMATVSEFRITKMQPGVAIEANFAEVQAWVDSLVEMYSGTVVTPAYYKQAKRDRASVNSVVKSIDQRRLEVKTAYMHPISLLEAKVKELTAPLQAVSADIDRQIKAIEEIEKTDKRAELKHHYEEFAGILVDALPFERIEDPKWLNRTFNLMTAFEEIEAAVERIAKDDAALDELNLSHPVEAKAAYFATLDISAAIARSKALDEQAERARVFEEQKAALTAAPTPEEAAPVTAGSTSDVSPPSDGAEAVSSEPTFDFTFTVHGTLAQRDQVIAALKSLGIQGTVKAS